MRLQIAKIYHHIPGRLHLKLDQGKHSAAVLTQLKEQLETSSFIESVKINPTTGSLIIIHRAEHQQIINYLLANYFDEMAEFSQGKDPLAKLLRKAIRNGVKELDLLLKPISGGRLDTTSLLLIVLAYFAYRQIKRGSILPAGLTIAGMGFGLLFRQPSETSSPK